eukprot:8974403-Pyramimonas_sp.AAC.1
MGMESVDGPDGPPPDPSDSPSAAGSDHSDCFMVHQGTLAAARTIRGDLAAQRVLAEALAASPSWGLVVVGHSLGGSVAAVLTMLLRPEYPAVRCWAIDPAGGYRSHA